MGPCAIDHGSRDEWVFAARHQLSQLPAAIDLSTGIDLVVKENRVGDLHFAAAFFVIHRARVVGWYQLGVIVDLASSARIKFAMGDPPRLTQEAVDFPEAVLFPFVKGMVVTLRALHLNTHQEPGCLGSGLHGFVVVAHLCQQEIDRAVFVRATFGGDEVAHHLVPGPILGERLAEKSFHTRAIDEADLFAADRQICPERRPIANITWTIKKLVDEGGTLGRALVPMKALDLIPRGDMAHQIKMHAAKPLLVVGGSRRGDIVLGPSLTNLLVNKRDDRIVRANRRRQRLLAE